MSSTATAFMIKNTGEAESGSISALVSGDAVSFTAANGCSSLAGGGTCIVSVTFNPKSSGTKTGTLVVSGSPGGTVMANLMGVGTNPSALVLAPTGTQSFGDVVIGATVTAKRFTVTNSGGVATGTLSVTGAGDTTRFPTSNDTCSGQTLAAGANCHFDVTFTPNASGQKSATFTVLGSPGGMVIASVSGNGQTPAHIATPSTLVPFGTVTVGQSSAPTTILFTNTGDVATSALAAPTVAPAGEFAIQSENCSGAVLQPLGANSCSVIVVFSPTAGGARPNRTLTVSGTPNGGTVAVTLTGSGNQPGALTSAPTSHPFGNVNIGSTQDFQFTITNTSTTQTVTAVTATTDASQYTIVGGTTCQGATLAPSATCVVAVRFTPSGSASVEQDGTLTVSGSGASAPAIVPMTGFAVSPANISISPPGTFGSVVIGASSMKTFTVTNNGGTATPVPTVSLVSPDFTANNGCTAAIPAGGNCTIVVTFTPTAPAGAKTATLTVTAGNTVNHALTGDAITNAQLQVNPSSLTFDPTTLGDTSNTQSFTVTNNGSTTSGAITITRTGNADFTQTNNCTAALANGQSCTVTVTFAPTVQGARQATFTVNAAPGGGAQVVANGVGVQPLQIVAPAMNPFDFGTVLTSNSAPNDSTDPFVIVTIKNNKSVAAVLTLPPFPSGSPFYYEQTHCGSAFFTTQCCFDGETLSPAGTFLGTDNCSYTVYFHPNDAQSGPQSGSQALSIGQGAFDTTTVSFTGTGNTNRLAISPNPATFGTAAAPVGIDTSSAPVTLTVRNQAMVATGPINISQITYPWHVTSDMCTGMSIPAGGMCTVTVVYHPSGQFGGCVLSGSVTVTDQTGAVNGDTSVLKAFCDNANVLFLQTDSGNFGPTFLNATPVRTLTYKNPSASAPASVTVALTGSAQFTRPAGLAGGTCATSVPASGTCTVILKFNPLASSQDMLVTGTLTVNGNAIAVSGTPLRTINISSNTLGSTAINGGITVTNFTVQNVSNAATTVTSITTSSGEATVVNNGCGAALAPSDTCAFQVRFAPTTAGDKSITLTAQAGAAGALGTDTEIVTAHGAGIPLLKLDPTSYNFGTLQVTAGGSVDQDFTVTNIGESTSGTVTFSGLAAPFSYIGGNTCSGLSPGGSCSVTVRFDPSAAGAAMDTITVSSAAIAGTVPASAQATADVSGAGVLDTIGLTVENASTGDPSAFFDPTAVNPPAASQEIADFIVTNSSGSAIALDNTITPGDFVRDHTGTFPAGAPDCGASIAAGSGGVSCTVRIRFIPTTAGSKAGTLTVSSALGVNAGLYGSAFTAATLTGLMTVDFGSLEILTNATPKTLTLTNTGTAEIDNLAFAAGVPNGGDFSFGNSCVNATLTAGQSCQLDIGADLGATGARSSLVTVTSSNGLSTTFTVMATGVNHPNVTVTGTATTETRVVGGVDATPTVFTLTNQGGATNTSGKIGIRLTGDTDDFVFATTGLTNPCGVAFPGDQNAPSAIRTTLAAGSSCQIGVLFNPTELAANLSVGVHIFDPSGTSNIADIANAGTGTSTQPVTATSPQTIAPNVNKVITFTNNSSVATSPLDTFVSDTTPGTTGMLSIVADTCLGATVAPGAACTVTVRLTPDASAAVPVAYASGFVEIYGSIDMASPPFATFATFDFGAAQVGGYNAVRVDLTP